MFEKFSDSGWKFVNALASARRLREKEIDDIQEVAENDNISDNAKINETKEDEK